MGIEWRFSRTNGVTRMRFTKMHGTGNDFIVIDGLASQAELDAGQVQWLCDRRLGIGADGLIVVRPSTDSECLAFMDYRNADGSIAEMCGNGVRCFAKFLVDCGYLPDGQRSLIAGTRAGNKAIRFEVDEQGQMTQASVDMGEPCFAPALVPTTLAAAQTSGICGRWGQIVTEAVLGSLADVRSQSGIEYGTLRFTCVNMGNPHAVCFLEEPTAGILGLSDSEFAIFARPLAEASEFPEQCNIEFVRVLASNQNVEQGTKRALFGGTVLSMRVYERGVGETMACGTGASAVAVAAALTGRAPRRSQVQLRGGVLDIDWRSDNHVLMTGPAKTVYQGEIAL
ncbi:MAG: diaminopimelate epimerase [Actinomycetia bacterium]|nr:diaminopimelate epimerase [Actinomycetes bacterium]